MIVTLVITVEFIRAWLIVSNRTGAKAHPGGENYEHSLIKKYWTRHLDESAIKRGDIYMVRDRLRWTLFQIALVGLQMNSVL